MRVLVIENRTKTKFYEKVLQELSLEMQDLEYAYLVQSHVYRPKAGAISYCIAYPSKKELLEMPDRVDGEFQRLLEIKRSRDLSEKVINYYLTEIAKIIESFNPHYIIGEPTLFHELIAIEVAKQKSIPYLSLSAARYPAGRFKFYKADTFESLYGSNDKWPKEEVAKYIQDIVHFNKMPDYMNARRSKLLRVYHWLKVYYGRAQGEKFNTPSLMEKVSSYLSIKQSIRAWGKISLTVNQLDKNCRYLLYPMHMQPESNIDVWGYRFRDQLVNIKSLADICQSNNMKLLVKANPKAKAEMTLKLAKLVHNHPAIIALELSSRMKDVFGIIDLVVTIMGTVSFECLFHKKPCVTMGYPLLEKYIPGSYVENFAVIASLISSGRYKQLTVESEEKMLEFMNDEIRTSYAGVISDRVSNLKVLDTENINLVRATLTKVFLNV